MDVRLFDHLGGDPVVGVRAPAFELSAFEVAAVLYVMAGNDLVGRHELVTAEDARRVVCTALMLEGYTCVGDSGREVAAGVEDGTVDAGWLHHCRVLATAAYGLGDVEPVLAGAAGRAA